jgi:putative flippase GtrA
MWYYHTSMFFLNKIEVLIEKILTWIGLNDPNKSNSLVKLSRFILSGSSAALVHFVLLYIFTEYFGIYYLVSTIISFILSSVVAFLMHKFWTYKNHNKEKIPSQFSFHFLVVGINLVLNTFLVYIFVEWIGLWYILAQFTISIILAFESFFILGWVFRHRTHSVTENHVVSRNHI